VTRPSPILITESLRVQYRNGALGILNVSFSVAPGQIVAMFGANGAGKTTTVRAVSGFLKTEGARVIAGRVLFENRDVTNSEPHNQAKAGLAFVPERNKVFADMSVAENLAAVGRSLKGPRRAELHSLIFSLFPVLAERRTQVAGSLSGGQRQMLALARAMSVDPKVLIVDEMTLGLHHSVHPELFHAVREVAARGAAVVLVDENTGLALQAADYCYLLRAGAVHDEGPPAKFHGNELMAAGYVDAP
jgi:branched-chain amino acid transport system ATP-binding protein